MTNRLFLLLFSLLMFTVQIFSQKDSDVGLHPDLKNSKLHPEPLDSLSHHHFKQNDFHLLSEMLHDTWDSTQWNEEQRTVFTYDSEENLSEEKLQIWNGTSWVNDTRILYGYENGNPTFDEHHKWNGTGWLNDWRNSSAYDANGNIILYIVEIGDSLSWVYVWRNFYYWNSNHLIDSAKFEAWDSEWISVSLTTYFYTTDERDSLYILYDFNETSAEWEPASRRTYTYDDAVLSYEELLEQWSGIDWVNDSWSVHTYNSNDNLIEETFRQWEDNEWENWYKNIYSLNAQNLRTEFKRQIWNGLGWNTDWRRTYEYNANGIITDEVYQDYNFGDWINISQIVHEYDPNNLLTISTRQEWDGTIWVNDYRERYFYEPSTSVEDEVITHNFYLYNNYPNPFNPTTKISWQSAVSSWQTLKVYDVLGNEIATLVNEVKPAGNYEIEFDASGLTSGIYFYRLIAGNFVETRKMLMIK